MVARPLPVCNAKVAAIFRVVEMTKPTLLMDEADTYFHDNDELRGILNAGHRKGGYVLRCEGDDLEPRMFSTWAPAAIAAIGKLPDTLNDRAVPCRMHRRKPSEKVKSFRIDRTDDLAVLARKAARWAADSEEFLRKADPDVGALSNRVADNWRPLLAIADAAGSQWPARIQAASVKAASKDDPSTKVQLLKDVKAFFKDRGDPHAVFGRELLDHLISMDDRRWGEWSRGSRCRGRNFRRFWPPSKSTRVTCVSVMPQPRVTTERNSMTHLPPTPPIQPRHRDKACRTATSRILKARQRNSMSRFRNRG
jgi:putative DNA primase/helicase